MKNELKSISWADTIEAIKKCHLSILDADSANTDDWILAFNQLVDSINDERKLNPEFCPELAALTIETGLDYHFSDILEDYFNFLEEAHQWDAVISSCDTIMELFKWEKSLPSQYMFRKGNALEKSKRFAEAEAFGKEWLEKYPTDLYGVASNVYLMLELNKLSEAQALTQKYLRDDLICDSSSDTFFMAAYRLFEMTDDINAKQRVERKMADYQDFC